MSYESVLGVAWGGMACLFHVSSAFDCEFTGKWGSQNTFAEVRLSDVYPGAPAAPRASSVFLQLLQNVSDLFEAFKT